MGHRYSVSNAPLAQIFRTVALGAAILSLSLPILTHAQSQPKVKLEILEVGVETKDSPGRCLVTLNAELSNNSKNPIYIYDYKGTSLPHDYVHLWLEEKTNSEAKWSFAGPRRRDLHASYVKAVEIDPNSTLLIDFRIYRGPFTFRKRTGGIEGTFRLVMGYYPEGATFGGRSHETQIKIISQPMEIRCSE